MIMLPWDKILLSVAFLCCVGIILSVILVLAEKKIMNFGICRIDVNSGGKVFEVNGGESLLSSLAEKDIFIPSACGGRGSCAYCKVQVHSGGGVTGPVEAPFLSPEEIKKNIRLSCQVKVRSDISVTVPEELFRVKKFRGIIEEKKLLTHDIAGLKIKLISPDNIDFTAGQYIQLESKKYKGRDIVNRAYSIASVPSDKNSIDLMIRKVPGGICTTWVFDLLQQGEEVNLSGPYGDFRLSGTDSPIIFIAGGSGMAPIWSILNDMKEKNINRGSCYFFGALTEKDLFYTEELREFEKTFPEFRYIPSLSNEPESSTWNGERGLVTECIKSHIPDLTSREAYLCGSPGMIDACIKVLTDGGMPESRIFYDKFT